MEITYHLRINKGIKSILLKVCLGLNNTPPLGLLMQAGKRFTVIWKQ